MREKLINTLLEEFEQDKVRIVMNLLLAMDEIMLEASNEYGEAILTIKIENKRSEKNECMGENEKE